MIPPSALKCLIEKESNGVGLTSSKRITLKLFAERTFATSFEKNLLFLRLSYAIISVFCFFLKVLFK